MGRYALAENYQAAKARYGVSSATVALAVRLARLANKYGDGVHPELCDDGDTPPGEDVRYWQGRSEAFLEVVKLQLRALMKEVGPEEGATKWRIDR